MVEVLQNGSTSTPLRGFSTQGYTRTYPRIAPAIDPKKISKDFVLMLDLRFLRVHNTCILNNKSEDLYNESNR
jgi:hypothetical protein